MVLAHYVERLAAASKENTITSKEKLSELITHMAFYAGWPNAMSSVAKTKELLGTASS